MKRITTFLSPTLFLYFFTANAQMDFEYYKIDEFNNRMGQVSLVDIDKDGDIDICSKPREPGEHFFLENKQIR